jgi:glycosyltransferase involved in cell wall biosynthesis
LFAVQPAEVSKGKMAMKVIDYMAAGLPVVATPVGLPPALKDGENALYASTEDEWLEKLTLLIENAGLREKLGRAARKAMEEQHELKRSYALFKKINAL